MTDNHYPEDFSKYRIGENYGQLKTKHSKDNASAMLSLISQARKTIDLFTHDLSPNLLDSIEITESIKYFIRISRNSHFRILICNPEDIAKRGHRLIELSRQFSSFISIRKTYEEYQSTPFSLLMVDEKAMVYRPDHHEYYGVVNFNTRYECRQQGAFFNTVWELSEPASALRRLFI